MKILSTSDIHQLASKWKEVVKECADIKPDVLAIAGDIFPHNNGILAEMDFVQHLEKYAEQIKADNEQIEIVLTLGNDDNQLLIPKMQQGEDKGLWHYLNGDNVVEIGGIEFVGMPFVPDYPFAYKYWCHPEFVDEPRIDPQSFGIPCEVNSNNEFVDINDFESYFKAKKPIYDILKDLADQIIDMKKSIWLIHAPPSNHGLDVCAHGAKVGSNAVLKFIEEYQPFITIHGHIHESPEYNGKKWKSLIGDTLAIQGGQIDRDLNYTVLDIDNGIIKSIEHSKYWNKY